MTSLVRLTELYAMLRVKLQMRNIEVNLGPEEKDLQFCYDILQSVSRSFAIVIIQLQPELRNAVCVFYLVLRGLDTVEDDMSVPVDQKLRELPIFHEKLQDVDWCIDGIGEGRERELLQQFYRVSREFHKLKPGYQQVISDICKRMADGMCEFLQRRVVTKEDFDLYCHYVAGLVGHGLTRLFAQSSLESSKVADDLTDANHMGLFLQKVNIIRDFYEDICEEPPRIFWPRDIYSTFTDDLNTFKKPSDPSVAVSCLNAMIADAMVHAPHVIDYLSSLREASVQAFCGIPQVMAIATLEKLYNNPDVFCSKVKISKGVACRIMLYTKDLESSLNLFREHCSALQNRLDPNDPSYEATRQLLADTEVAMNKYQPEQASYTRNLLTRYPLLGGQMFSSIIDGVRWVFGAQPRPVVEAKTQ